MEELDTDIAYDGNIPESFREVQQILDRFVAINYDIAETMAIDMDITVADLTQYRSRILDIIRNNPPLASVPRYFQDGRKDYLWYSDFYYDASREVWLQYNKFAAPQVEITQTNYAEELAKINLPYFGELVDLISLEKLCVKYEKRFSVKEQAVVQVETTAEPDKPELPKQIKKRSYEPKLSKEQYKLLAECIEEIRLFRLKVKTVQLRKLFSGKLNEALQVTNQKTLVYLLDQLMEAKYIKDTWMAVADGNKDFISFRTEGNKQRYGDKEHYITLQQLVNSRNRNKREQIYGLENIDDLIEQMQEDSAE